MKSLGSIRTIPIINRVGRNIIKPFRYINFELYQYLYKRWPLSGDIPLDFENIKFYLHSDCDDGIAHSMYFNKDYVETADLSLFLSLVRTRKTFIDVGANTGLYSILGKIANPALKVYSFEPHPNNYARLIKNHKLNNLQIDNLFDIALGSGTEDIGFAIPSDNRIIDVSSADINFSKSMYENEISWKSIKVKQTTLDLTISRLPDQSVDLIKIDVENYEIPVFEGGKESIARIRPEIICELFLTEEKMRYFNKFIQDCKFNVYVIENKGMTLLKNGLEHNPSGLNFYFTPFNYGEFVSYSAFKHLKPL